MKHAGHFLWSGPRMPSEAQQNSMKSLTLSATAGLAAFLAIGCAAIDTTAPTTPPSATVKIEEWSAAYDVSAATGKGTLTYNGRNHPFSITGLGAGGTGVQQMSATGKVYHMNSLTDFPGTYHGISKGLTLIEGKLHAKLTNGNGVVMYIAGETEGLASATGVREFEVSFSK